MLIPGPYPRALIQLFFWVVYYNILRYTTIYTPENLKAGKLPKPQPKTHGGVPYMKGPHFIYPRTLNNPSCSPLESIPDLHTLPLCYGTKACINRRYYTSSWVPSRRNLEA